MEVKLTLHGILRDYLPRQAKGKTTLTLPDGTTIQDIIEQLKIKHGASVAVNNQEVETSYVVQDGDEVQLFRLIGGG